MKDNRNLLVQFFKPVAAFIIISIFSPACKKEKTGNDITVIEAVGDIKSKVDEFRQLLGAQLNTTPGAVGGRREVNWDGVPAELLNKPLASDFFNTPGPSVPATRQTGLVYSAGLSNFQVCSDGFKNTNSATAAAFTAFSGSQTFANAGTNLWDIGFQAPGQPIDATVRGFGIVFSDVDVPNSTFLEFFNESESLGKFFAPVHDANTSLSFLGIYFNDQRVTHVEVGHDGTLSEGGNDISTGGKKDFVVFDDFLFDEPVKQ
jgi:hypothetical protein